MSALPAARDHALAFALEGVRVQRAAQVLKTEAARLSACLRRAVPFLTRRSIPVALEYARAVAPSELARTLTGPLHVTLVSVEPGGGEGALVLDGPATAMLIDGVFGGDGKAVPALDLAGLTAPQGALTARLAGDIVRALSETLGATASVRLAPRPGNRELSAIEGVPIACVLTVGSGDAPGHVVLLIPKEALLARAEERASPRPGAPTNPRVAAALDDVEIDVVVELARTRIRLEDLARLRQGDVLRLDLGVDSPVTVRVDDRALLQGLPVSVGGSMAIRIGGGTKTE